MSGIAAADPVIETFSGPAAPDYLGGYQMTPIDAPASSPGSVSSVASPTATGGDILFQQQGGATLDMTVDDPDWWQWADHGNVYTTDIHWVELILPANTRALSFFVGAEFSGRGWIQAFDSNNQSTVLDPFYVGVNRTPGFGVYSSDSCAAITRVIIEPEYWGVGQLAINQDPCATSISEPAPLGLLAFGLLALAISRRLPQMRAETA